MESNTRAVPHDMLPCSAARSASTSCSGLPALSYVHSQTNGHNATIGTTS